MDKTTGSDAAHDAAAVDEGGVTIDTADAPPDARADADVEPSSDGDALAETDLADPGHDPDTPPDLDADVAPEILPDADADVLPDADPPEATDALPDTKADAGTTADADTLPAPDTPPDADLPDADSSLDTAPTEIDTDAGVAPDTAPTDIETDADVGLELPPDAWDATASSDASDTLDVAEPSPDAGDADSSGDLADSAETDAAGCLPELCQDQVLCTTESCDPTLSECVIADAEPQGQLAITFELEDLNPASPTVGEIIDPLVVGAEKVWVMVFHSCG